MGWHREKPRILDINPITQLLRRKSLVLGGNIVVAIASLGLTSLIIRSAGPANYGSFVIASSMVAFLYGISTLGMDFRYKRDFSTDFLTESNRWPSLAPQLCAQAGIVITLGMICFFAAPQITSFFHADSLPRWSIPLYLLIYALYGQASDYFRYSSRIRPTVAMAIGFVAGQLLLTGALWMLKGTLTLTDLFIGLFGALLLTIGAALRFIIPELKPRRLQGVWSKWGGDLKIGYPSALNFAVDHAMNSTGRYALAALVSVSTLAHYNTAFLVAGFGLLLPRASGVVLPPLMARHFDAGTPELAANLLIWTTRVYLMFSLPFVIGSILLEKKILTFLATAEVAGQAHFVLPWLAAGYVCYGLLTIWANALFVTRELPALLRINATAAVVAVLCTCGSVYLTSNITLAAVSFFLSYALAGAMMLRQLNKLWRIRESFSVLPRTAIAVGAMTIAILLSSPLLTNLPPLINLLSLISIGIVAYGLALYALGLQHTILGSTKPR